MCTWESKLPLITCLLSWRSRIEVTAAKCFLENMLIEFWLFSWLISHPIPLQQPTSPPESKLEVSLMRVRQQTPPLCSTSSWSFAPVLAQNILITPLLVPTAIMPSFSIFTMHRADWDYPSGFLWLVKSDILYLCSKMKGVVRILIGMCSPWLFLLILLLKTMVGSPVRLLRPTR